MSKFGLEQSSVNKLFGKVLDLTGQRFGRLTAQEYVGNGNWNCLCTCGNHKIYSTSQLRAGNAKTCQECLKNEAKIKIGTRFGRLVVVEQLQEQKRGRAQARCKCDCGNVLNVLSNSLKNGNTQSCGCLHKEVARELGKKLGQHFGRSSKPRKDPPSLQNHLDLRGKKFGRLEPILYLGKSKWSCQCDCGNKTIVGTCSLQDGNTQSCGCLNHEAVVKRNIAGRIELQGHTFNRLTVVDYKENKGWICKCSCGKNLVVRSSDLTSGNTQSCGCLKTENIEQLVVQTRERFFSLLQKYQNFKLKSEYTLSINHLQAWCSEHCRFFRINPSTCLMLNRISGCSECKKRSNPEKQIYEFIVNLIGKNQIILPQKQKIINNRRYLPDIVIPSKKLIIECNGIFYHSAIVGSEKDNPKRHLERQQAFASLGYQTIFLWEDDWNSRQEAVKNYLSALLQPELLPIYDARKLQIESITQKQASIGLEKYHPQGLAFSKNEWLALTTSENKIVACMGFSTQSRPVLLQKNTSELTRYCSKGRVRGGASRLLARYCQDHPEINQIVSFSDNDYFAGGMYSAIGFKYAGEVSPDYTTIWEGRRRHKSFTKRSNLIKLASQGRIIFHPDTMTEKSCLVLNKKRRAWNSGKKRWIYYNPCMKVNNA